jgi:iron(III) transport system ATP-binding protein
MPRDDAMQAGLTITSVSHAYGAREVVRHVSVDVAPGELICLVGPSGCGKTTLLRLAAGLETLQQGRIAVAGTVVAEPGRSLPPESRGIGMDSPVPA